MDIDHRRLLVILEELMKPISSVKIDEQEQLQLTINVIFSSAIDRCFEQSASINLRIPNIDNEEPVYLRYVQCHLYLVEKLLSYEQNHISSHTPLFSIQDESILSCSLSFIILLGLVIHFDEGIFLSIENYLNYSKTSAHLLKLKTTLSHHHRMHYLNQMLTMIMNIITTKINRNSIFVQRLCSNYLLELILSHLQLLHSPNLKYSFEHFMTKTLHENLIYLQENYSTIFIQQIMLLNRLLTTTINSPIWLKQRCGDLLTSILIHPNQQGIRHILDTIVESTVPNDRLYISIAKILSTCPKQLQSDEYIQRIKYQLFELLHHSRFTPIISLSINQLLNKHQKVVEDELFLVLFQPLILCHNYTKNEICTNEQLELFMNDVYHLISMVPNEQIRIYLYENYLNELINIYLALEQSLSSLKMQFFNILTILFSSMSLEICIECLKRILFKFKYLSLRYLVDLSVTYNLIIDSTIENYDVEVFCQMIIKILFSITNDHRERIMVKLFLDLLQSLVTNQQISIVRFQITQILKSIMEYLTEHIDIFLKNIDDSIRTIQIILEKVTNDNDDEDLSSDNEALQIILTIASLLVTHYDQLSFENKTILASFYSSLIWIEKHHSNKELRQLAHELSVAFVTYGAVKDASNKSEGRLLIEEVNDERDLREETFENALACLNDASLPVRAHGLILFRRLIERHDPKTLSNIQNNDMNLFQQFQQHLQADDSYEYLAAVNVLSALTNQHTERILPLLCDEYLNKERKLEDRLKVGEILVKTSRLLGDFSTKYSSLLFNTFLNASKQTNDDMYRASALSNLGQLCTVLKYSLTKHLAEILTALKSYLSIFESPEVRRASILVCELLCQSLEQSTWITILDNELPSFYKLINHLYKNDKDEIVCLHAQIAIEALNKISQEYLQPPVILEKRIRILS